MPSFLHHLQQQQSTPELSQKAKHPHIAAPQPEAKEAHTLCPPASGPPPFPAFVVSGSSVSQPQAIAHVPAHMHLLCDVLPCPIKSSDVSRQQNISQSIDESHAKAVHKKTQVTKNSKNNFTDEPIREHTPSPPPGSSAVTEGEGPSHHIRPEIDKKEKALTKESERKTPMSSRRQKKSRSSIGTCTQCTKFKSECLIKMFYAGILWTGNMLMSLALQTGVLHIKDFPKRLCHQQSSSNREEARFPVRDALVIMHHHPLRSTVS